MIALLRRSARRGRDDSGFSMILVIGFMLVVGVLVAASLGVATNSLSSSRQHMTFEQAITTAESGVDQGLARLQQAYNQYVTDYPVPDKVTPTDPSPLCVDDPANWLAPVGGFASEAAERTWARAQLLKLATTHPQCLQNAASGQYILMKPANRQTVYAMGWVPSFANAQKSRVVKAEYIFAPWKPAVAVLTGGNLEIDSSSTIKNSDNSTLAGGVHTNGNISVQGNPTVYGPVSASGSASGGSTKFVSNPGGSVIIEPPMRLPEISALQVYMQNYQSYSATDWFDLCSDGSSTGTIRAPSAGGPCTGAVDATISGSQTFRGWSFGMNGGVATWTAGKNILGNAVYYVNGGNITVGGGVANIPSTTLIASAVPKATMCPKTGGNIYWNGYYLGQPKIPNLFMLAEADLQVDSHFSAGSLTASGAFVAGDQINMQTSSDGAYGSVVAADQCAAGPGEVDIIKNPAITFTPNSDSPFASIIDTTLWLEYVGS